MGGKSVHDDNESQIQTKARHAMNASSKANTPDDTSAEPSPPDFPPVATVRSEELLRGGRQLRIVHGDQIYRLLLTRNNKLILQK